MTGRYVIALPPNSAVSSTHSVVTALANGSKRRAVGRARYAQR
jgi:hypothetical protein